MLGGKEAGADQSRGSAFRQPTLPVLCFSWQDRLINPVYGSFEIRDKGAEKPLVYPFMEDILEMQVHLIGGAETPEHISYELRDEKEERLIAKGKVSEFQEETGGCSFRLSFQDIISFDEYYYLRIQLPFGGREVLYDTRILKVSSRETVSMLTEYAIHRTGICIAMIQPGPTPPIWKRTPIPTKIH